MSGKRSQRSACSLLSCQIKCLSCDHSLPDSDQPPSPDLSPMTYFHSVGLTSLRPDSTNHRENTSRLVSHTWWFHLQRGAVLRAALSFWLIFCPGSWNSSLPFVIELTLFIRRSSLIPLFSEEPRIPPSVWTFAAEILLVSAGGLKSCLPTLLLWQSWS